MKNKNDALLGAGICVLLSATFTIISAILNDTAPLIGALVAEIFSLMFMHYDYQDRK